NRLRSTLNRTTLTSFLSLAKERRTRSARGGSNQRDKRLVISSQLIRTGFLTIATSTFFTLRSPDELKSIGLPSAFRTRTKATSRAGRILEGSIYAVAATHGSFPTRQFRAALRSGRIPRRFLFNSPNGASNSTASRESKRCSIRFLVLEIQQSLRSAAA